MNRTEYMFLQAEKNSLSHLIETAPKQAVISLKSLQSRLSKVESLLKTHSVKELPVEGRIFFRGKPVLGTQGIESAFATTIMNDLTEMIATKAASYQGALNSAGRIANRDAYRMNITGTTAGSFGFVFEECLSDHSMLFKENSPIESALIDCSEFFNVLQRNDEEELANIIDSTEDRVLRSIRKFLDDLIANEAVCALESGSASFRFSTVSEVENCSQRIKEDNISEWSEEKVGKFVGVLVSERKFDFRSEEPNEPLLKGKISSHISDLEEIGRTLYQKSFKIFLRAKQVGTGPCRFTLESFEPCE